MRIGSVVHITLPALVVILVSCGVPPTGSIALGDAATTNDGGRVVIDVLLNDRAPAGESLTVTSVDGAVGDVVISSDGRLEYIARADFVGTDEFEYTVVSSESRSEDDARVRVEVRSRATTTLATSTTTTSSTTTSTSSTTTSTSSTTTSTSSTTTSTTIPPPPPPSPPTTAVPDVERPSAPSGLTARAEGKLVHLWWDESVDNVAVAIYQIYRDTTLVAQVAHPQTTYDDAGVEFGTRYVYHVIAVDTSGNGSEPSAHYVVATPEGPDMNSPTAPQIVLGRQTFLTRGIELVWYPSSDDRGVVRYEVMRLDAVDGVPSGRVLIASLSGGTTRYDDAEQLGWQYDETCRDAWVDYWVTAVDAAGNRSTESFRRVVFEFECFE